MLLESEVSYQTEHVDEEMESGMLDDNDGSELSMPDDHILLDEATHRPSLLDFEGFLASQSVLSTKKMGSR